MARNQKQMLPAPMGEATSSDVGSLSIDRAQLLEGFFPGRSGTLQNFPQIRSAFDYATNPGMEWLGGSSNNPGIIGMAYYRAAVSPRDDLLLLFGADRFVYALPLTYDAPTEQYKLHDWSNVGVNNNGIMQMPPYAPEWDFEPANVGGGIQNRAYPWVRTIQFNDETIIVREDGMTPFRFGHEVLGGTFFDGFCSNASLAFNSGSGRFRPEFVGLGIVGPAFQSGTIITAFDSPYTVHVSRPTILGSSIAITYIIGAGISNPRIFKLGLDPVTEFFTQDTASFATGASSTWQNNNIGFRADDVGRRVISEPADQFSGATGTTTNNSQAVTSSADFFFAADVGKVITGTNIPAGTRVLTYTDAQHITIDRNATGTASNLVLTIKSRVAFDNNTFIQGFTDATHVVLSKPVLATVNVSGGNVGFTGRVLGHIGADATTGGQIAAGVFGYKWCGVDERGRLGSPSPAAYVTATAGCVITLQVRIPDNNPDTGLRKLKLYRTKVGGTEFYLLGDQDQPINAVPSATFTTLDSTPDAMLDIGDICPSPGDSDPPGAARIVAEWKNRVVFDSVADRNIMQMSNEASPVQFASFADPLNDADAAKGTSLTVGSELGDEITGFQKFGALLGVTKRTSYHQVQGDNLTNFTVRPAHQRGNEAPGSFVRCDLEVPYLSDDGVYTLAYVDGFTPKLLSNDISDQFYGDFSAHVPPAPSGLPRYKTSAAKKRATGWYWGNRYFLAIGGVLHVYDFQGGEQAGWSHHNIFVQRACVVKQAGRPETVFMAMGTDYPTPRGFIGYFHAGFQDVAGVQQPTLGSDLVTCRVVTKAPDGEGIPRERLKRFKRLTVFGTNDFHGTADNFGNIVIPMVAGTIRGEVSGVFSHFQLNYWPSVFPPGVLFSFEPEAGMLDELITIDLTFNARNLVISNILPEYLPAT